MERQDVTQALDTQASEDLAPGSDAADPDRDASVPAETEVVAAPPKPPTVGQLRRERKRLWEERQEVVYHVGGLAVDLHRRGLLADDLVSRRAEVAAAIDGRLVEIDGLLAEHDEQRRQGRVRMPPAAGYCLSCGAPYLADAAFCSRCGARIHVPVTEAETGVIAPSDPDAT